RGRGSTERGIVRRASRVDASIPGVGIEGEAHVLAAHFAVWADAVGIRDVTRRRAAAVRTADAVGFPALPVGIGDSAADGPTNSLRTSSPEAAPVVLAAFEIGGAVEIAAALIARPAGWTAPTTVDVRFVSVPHTIRTVPGLACWVLGVGRAGAVAVARRAAEGAQTLVPQSRAVGAPEREVLVACRLVGADALAEERPEVVGHTVRGARVQIDVGLGSHEDPPEGPAVHDDGARSDDAVEHIELLGGRVLHGAVAYEPVPDENQDGPRGVVDAQRGPGVQGEVFEIVGASADRQSRLPMNDHRPVGTR